MDLDITPHIKELLFENNSLVIPGFGALILTYAPSTIDHVQGLLDPPSKTISFDKNLVVNDGKLVNIIQEKHQTSTEEANLHIAKFVNKMKDQLNKREMVNIANVGRLYKDFENTVQFIPDSTNFSKDAYGLPTVKFYPILRDKITPDTIVPRGNTQSIKKKKKASYFQKFQKYSEENSWLPIALITTMFIVLGGYGAKKFGLFDTNTSEDKKVNERPAELRTTEETASAMEESSEEELRADNDAEDFASDDEMATTNDEDIIDTESSTLSPNQQIAVVSVGIFGNKKNAQKRIEQVYDYGYDALPNTYLKKGKELTQIGIQFAFETEEEYNETLRHIRKRFKDAKVIRRE